MNEVFTNALEIKLTIDDSGISIQQGEERTEFPYGSVQSKLKVGFLGAVDIKGHGISKTFVAYGKDKDRLKWAVDYAERMNSQAAPCMPKEYSKEFIKRCNLCGHVFCFTAKDLARNKELAEDARHARNMSFMEALGGTILASNQEESRADNLESRIIDYSKCPKCNSNDLADITADEYKALKEKQNAAASTPISPADELKKFKELLDMGILTQEEFDAKKKQLLGL